MLEVEACAKPMVCGNVGWMGNFMQPQMREVAENAGQAISCTVGDDSTLAKCLHCCEWLADHRKNVLILSDPEPYNKVLIICWIRIIEMSKKHFRWDSTEYRVDTIESPGTRLSIL